MNQVIFVVFMCIVKIVFYILSVFLIPILKIPQVRLRKDDGRRMIAAARIQ